MRSSFHTATIEPPVTISDEDMDPTWHPAPAAAAGPSDPFVYKPIEHPSLDPRVTVSLLDDKPIPRHEPEWLATFPGPRLDSGVFASVTDKLLSIIPEPVFLLDRRCFNEWMNHHGVREWLLREEALELSAICRQRQAAKYAQMRKAASHKASDAEVAIKTTAHPPPIESQPQPQPPGVSAHPPPILSQPAPQPPEVDAPAPAVLSPPTRWPPRSKSLKSKKRAKPDAVTEAWLSKLPGPRPAGGPFDSVNDKLLSIIPSSAFELPRIKWNMWTRLHRVKDGLTTAEERSLSVLRRKLLGRKYARDRRAGTKARAAALAAEKKLEKLMEITWSAKKHREFPQVSRNIVLTVHLCNAREREYGPGLRTTWSRLPRLPTELVWFILSMLTGRDIGVSTVFQQWDGRCKQQVRWTVMTTQSRQQLGVQKADAPTSFRSGTPRRTTPQVFASGSSDASASRLLVKPLSKSIVYSPPMGPRRVWGGTSNPPDSDDNIVVPIKKRLLIKPKSATTAMALDPHIYTTEERRALSMFQ